MSAKAVMTRHVALFAVLLIVLGVFGMSEYSTTKAQAAPNQDALSVYLDNPFVQGSYVAASGGTGVSWMNFNGTTGLGQCGAGAPTGVTITGSCRIDVVAPHGGATPDANNGTATVGGSGSNFPTTVDSVNPVVINLSENSRYMGLWWSAGSSANTMKFYKDNTLLLTLTTNSIINLLGSAPTSQTDWDNKNNYSDANVITSADGTTKNIKARYFGNPRFYTSTTNPTAYYAQYGYEPFVYLHLFAGGNLSFNKVELSGGGFEFDNLALSTAAKTVDQRLVFVNQILSNHTVQFNSNGSGTQGAMANQVSNTTTALRSNAFTRTGYYFGGWTTEADGSGTSYANSASYDFDADITLYAKWNAISYNVTYDTQGGSSVAGGTYATGSSITLPQAPHRNGYSFAGWFTSSSGGNALGASYAPTGTGNITLFAQWTTNSSPTPSPSPAVANLSLANTGSFTGTLLGTFGFATLIGMLLFALAARLRRNRTSS